MGFEVLGRERRLKTCTYCGDSGVACVKCGPHDFDIEDHDFESSTCPLCWGQLGLGPGPWSHDAEKGESDG